MLVHHFFQYTDTGCSVTLKSKLILNWELNVVPDTVVNYMSITDENNPSTCFMITLGFTEESIIKRKVLHYKSHYDHINHSY